MASKIYSGIYEWIATKTTDAVRAVIDRERARWPEYPKAHIDINFEGTPAIVYFDEEDQVDKLYIRGERAVPDDVYKKYDLGTPPLEKFERWKKEHGRE